MKEITTMPRLIDGDELFVEFWRKANPFIESEKVPPQAVWNAAATMVREAPTIDAEPVRHGRWKFGEDNCPICGENKFKGLGEDVGGDWFPPYCPSCGAKMDGDVFT
jgi:hypothetical protein